VYVFLTVVENERLTFDLSQDFAQPLYQDICFFSAQQTLLSQHPAVGHATLNVITVQTLIEADGRSEAFNHLVGCFPKPTLPEFTSHIYSTLKVDR
jgi:hypothetical protein